MYCNHCGSSVPDDTKFCPSCGAQLGAAQPQQGQDAAQPVQPAQNQQQSYEQPNNYAQGYNQPYGAQPMYQPYQYVQPMKWYKFLIYFALFAGAVVDIINAVYMFTGIGYEAAYGSAAAAYYVFPGLQALDIVYGVMLIGLAAFAVYIRFRLSGYKKNGPKLLIANYVLTMVISLIYEIINMLIVLPVLMSYATAAVNTTFISSSIGSIIGSVIGTVIMIIVNKIYFDKRKHLFVN